LEASRTLVYTLLLIQLIADAACMHHRDWSSCPQIRRAEAEGCQAGNTVSRSCKLLSRLAEFALSHIHKSTEKVCPDKVFTHPHGILL